METIVGAVFHGDSFLGKDTAGFRWKSAIHYNRDIFLGGIEAAVSITYNALALLPIFPSKIFHQHNATFKNFS